MRKRAVVPFDAEQWAHEADGVRALVRDVDGKRWAVVDYAPGSGRPEWCSVGHLGFVLSGEIEYEFESGGSIAERARASCCPAASRTAAATAARSPPVCS